MNVTTLDVETSYHRKYGDTVSSPFEGDILVSVGYKINNNPCEYLCFNHNHQKPTKDAKQILQKLKVPSETKIISAHRTPIRMYKYASDAEKNNIGVIIAGAGGSAHLPGMIAALTQIPVLGVPIESKKLKGLDSLLSIAQMPKGIPVGTLAIGEDGAINAAILAASIISNSNPSVKSKLRSWRFSQTKSVKKNPK